MPAAPLTVNFERLKNDIEKLSQVGRSADMGIYRMAFSDGDMLGRNWLTQRIEAAGLTCSQDGAANLSALIETTAADIPRVMTGSHIDTVPGAGHLDGALGVICGLEALRVIKERGLTIKRPLELVAFSDEEGAFGGMFGSQAVTGKITPGWIHNAKNLDGITLPEAMARHGLDAMEALAAARSPGSIHAFVELHIEQGPVLDSLQKTIGVVEGICGLQRWEISLIGHANHAGTTPMHMRQDAFQGLAEFSGEIERILEEHGSPLSVATIGRVELLPGAANVVPGEVRFSLEFRDVDTAVIEALANNFRVVLSAISRRRALMFEFRVVSEMPPVSCDSHIQTLIAETAQLHDLQMHVMPSGAAHDTQQIASIAPAGMIFVPSKEGKSHSAAEWTSWQDIEAGANVLLNVLYRLAAE